MFFNLKLTIYKACNQDFSKGVLSRLSVIRSGAHTITLYSTRPALFRFQDQIKVGNTL